MENITIDQATSWILDKAFSPVALVTAFDATYNRPTGMAAGWTMPCSSEPLLYAAALWKHGYTHKVVQASDYFVINVPNLKLKETMKIFGSNHGDKVAKFDLAQVRFDWAKIAKVPILAEASAAYVCRKINQVEAGDHFIFIGEVVEAYIDPKQKTLINVGKRAEGERYIEV